MTVKFVKGKRGATVIGTGFLPLDLVYRDDDPTRLKAYAGGTCGNVLTILAFLGWNAYPIARHNKSPLAQIIKGDLTRWGVHLDFIGCEPTTLPPVVVQRVFGRPKGGKTHSFAWFCPGCGARLPSFKPVLAKPLEAVSHILPKPQVFFFDRLSRSALQLADHCARLGAVVVFEPSMIGDPKLFSEAVRLSHIIKYSQDRISAVHEFRGSAEPLLEIETMGGAGLRYRRSGQAWAEVEAFSIRRTIDTSGAGDWCTAGILHSICQYGVDGLRHCTDDNILEAVRVGQAMAAWNCQFEGARGGMYGVRWATWKKAVCDILLSGSTVEEVPLQAPAICPEILLEVCRSGSVRFGSRKSEFSAHQACAAIWPEVGGGKAVLH
jgi:fructokinase